MKLWPLLVLILPGGLALYGAYRLAVWISAPDADAELAKRLRRQLMGSDWRNEMECVGVTTGKRKVHAVLGPKTDEAESCYTEEPERR